MIYFLTSRNTEERMARNIYNIYIHNSNRNYKKLTATTISIKKWIGVGYKNYEKQCPGLEFRLIYLFSQSIMTYCRRQDLLVKNYKIFGIKIVFA